MKNAITRTRAFAKFAMKPAVILSISLAMLLLAACETNVPSGQHDSNTVIGPQNSNGSLSKAANVSTATAISLGSASTFAVLGGTTVTNAGPSIITGDVGVSPGTALTGFALSNTIVGPGTVTAGLGIVSGTIYAGGPVAAAAHNDAQTAYDYLVLQAPDHFYSGVTQLSQTLGDVTSFNMGVPLTPGVYNFSSSANLQVGGNLYLDFGGNPDALFIFQLGSTLVTTANSKVIAINTGSQTCVGSNVYWAVGSSATIDGAEFVGTVIAFTTITMTSAANTPPITNVSGRMLALGGEVTMVTDNISVCGTSGGGTAPPPERCRDFVTGGGWINYSGKATFGVSGGFKNGKFWGQLSYNDHQKKNGVKVKSTEVTAYTYIDPVTRQIEGFAQVNGQGSYAYKVIVVDKGEPGRDDSFSLEIPSWGYSAKGTLRGGNIQLHKACGESDSSDKEKYDDKDEKDGNKNCDND